MTKTPAIDPPSKIGGPSLTSREVGSDSSNWGPAHGPCFCVGYVGGVIVTVSEEGAVAIRAPYPRSFFAEICT